MILKASAPCKNEPNFINGKFKTKKSPNTFLNLYANTKTNIIPTKTTISLKTPLLKPRAPVNKIINIIETSNKLNINPPL